MHYKKSSCIFVFLLSFVFGRIAYAQDSTALQFGLYIGSGVVKSIDDKGKDEHLATDFRAGLNLITPFRKKQRFRFEFQAQYDLHLIATSYYTTIDNKWHHNLDTYRYHNLNFNFLFHLPLFYKERYKLFIAPGINTGLTYDDDFLYPSFGLILSLKQEFKLTNRLSLHLDINSLNQVFIFSVFGGVGAIFHFYGTLNFGLSWRIFKK